MFKPACSPPSAVFVAARATFPTGDLGCAHAGTAATFVAPPTEEAWNIKPTLKRMGFMLFVALNVADNCAVRCEPIFIVVRLIRTVFSPLQLTVKCGLEVRPPQNRMQP